MYVPSQNRADLTLAHTAYLAPVPRPPEQPGNLTNVPAMQGCCLHVLNEAPFTPCTNTTSTAGPLEIIGCVGSSRQQRV